MSLPWFPFHVNAYVSDTMALTTEGHGAYLLLMLHYYATEKAIPDRDQTLAAICKMPLDRWRDIRPDIEGFFEVGGGMWRHARIDAEITKANAKIDAKVNAGAIGARSKWGDKKPASATRSERLSAARLKGTHTPQEWVAIQAFCGTICLRCKEPSDRFFKDHIIPIYQDGSDSIDNIQPLCPKCSSSKGPECVDYRPDGWENAVKRPAESLANASQKPAHKEQDNNLLLLDARAREAEPEVRKIEPAADPLNIDSPLGGAIPIDLWKPPPVDPADSDLFHAFANRHMDEGTFSSDWPSLWEKFLVEERAKKLKKPKARVEVTKRPEPIPGKRTLISEAAFALAKQLHPILGISEHDPFAHGMPASMEVWLASWSPDVIIGAVSEIMGRRNARNEGRPGNMRYFEPAIAKAHADLGRQLPTAEPSTAPQDRAHGRRTPSKSLPEAARRLSDKFAALTGGGRVDGGGESGNSGGSVPQIGGG